MHIYSNRYHRLFANFLASPKLLSTTGFLYCLYLFIKNNYRIARLFGESKNLQIAIFEYFVEIISRIRCLNMPHSRTNEFMGGAHLSN